MLKRTCIKFHTKRVTRLEQRARSCGDLALAGYIHKAIRNYFADRHANG